MAAQTCEKAQTATLSGTTADSVTFTGSGKYLCVTNHDSTDKIYFRTDGTTAVAAADDAYMVPPNQSVTIGPSKFGGTMSFSIVGDGGDYTVALF